MLKRLIDKLSKLLKESSLRDKNSETGKERVSSVLKKDTINNENFVDGIKDFLNTPISELMTPRIDVFAFEASSTIGDILPIVVQKQFTKYPVYERDLDNIVGVLMQSDLIRQLVRGSLSVQIREIMRQPFFVPETKNAFELLKEFNKSNNSMAIVIDEYGGTSGIVTVSDIVKKLISGIKPGEGLERFEIQRMGEDGLVVDGKVHLEEIQDLLGVVFPEGDYDTIGGFLSHIAGKIPSEGEEIRYDHLIFRIEKADRRRVLMVRIKKEKPSPGKLH